SDRRSGDVGYHRVQWSSNREETAERLRAAGFPVRTGKPGVYRVETSYESYPEALAFARAMAAAGGLDIRRLAVIGAEVSLFTARAHLREGMTVLVGSRDGLVRERVDAIEVEDYDGPVHDLEVAPTHTYIADGVLVHNSIYAFRGAD